MTTQRFEWPLLRTAAAVGAVWFAIGTVAMVGVGWLLLGGKVPVVWTVVVVAVAAIAARVLGGRDGR